jgi:hypothetical protein
MSEPYYEVRLHCEGDGREVRGETIVCGPEMGVVEDLARKLVLSGDVEIPDDGYLQLWVDKDPHLPSPMWRVWPPKTATDRCVTCGQKLEAEGEHALCCSSGSYNDRWHDDPVCKACCGPHIPPNPQVEYFPEG